MFSCMGRRSKVRRKYNTLWVRFYFSVRAEFFSTGLVLICVDGYIFFILISFNVRHCLRLCGTVYLKYIIRNIIAEF